MLALFGKVGIEHTISDTEKAYEVNWAAFDQIIKARHPLTDSEESCSACETELCREHHAELLDAMELIRRELSNPSGE